MGRGFEAVGNGFRVSPRQGLCAGSVGVSDFGFGLWCVELGVSGFGPWVLSSGFRILVGEIQNMRVMSNKVAPEKAFTTTYPE